MNLYNVSIEGLSAYSYAKDFADIYARALNLVHSLELELTVEEPPEPLKNEEGKESYQSYSAFKSTGDLLILQERQILWLAINNYKFTVKQEIKLEIDDLPGTFKTVVEKNSTVNEIQNTYNNKCDVHMPGNMLASYNEVMLIEDSCSDVLQTHLTSGWRMIAACPQPDQRRPDYILGRYNPNKEVSDDAVRG